jgi:hypothetical protein
MSPPFSSRTLGAVGVAPASIWQPIVVGWLPIECAPANEAAAAEEVLKKLL